MGGRGERPKIRGCKFKLAQKVNKKRTELKKKKKGTHNT